MFRYEKVRELEIAFMRSHYLDLGNALSSITDRLVQGEFHCLPMEGPNHRAQCALQGISKFEGPQYCVHIVPATQRR